MEWWIIGLMGIRSELTVNPAIQQSSQPSLHSEIGGLPRIRTVFSPVKSRDFTVKVCNPGGHPQGSQREGGVEPPQPSL
jgi:hypothetical protein